MSYTRRPRSGSIFVIAGQKNEVGWYGERKSDRGKAKWPVYFD